MNKKITLYELLGLVKDGKAPKKVYGHLNGQYVFDDIMQDYKDEYGKLLFASLMMYRDKCLNDEVEILDDEDNKEETKPLTRENIEALGYACGEIKKCFENGWNKSLNNEPFSEDEEELQKMAFNYHVEDEKQNANNDRFKDFINILIDEINKLKKNK